jgi:hypothetical protein
MYVKRAEILAKFVVAAGLEHYAISTQMYRVNNVATWRETTLDPFISDYDDPVIISTPRKLRKSDKENVEQDAPRQSHEIFDDATHRWYLTGREDVTLFKLARNNDTTVCIVEINDFINMMQSYAVSKDLFTGLSYHIACIGNDNQHN